MRPIRPRRRCAVGAVAVMLVFLTAACEGGANLPSPSRSLDLPSPSRSIGLPSPSRSIGLPSPTRSVGLPSPSRSFGEPGGAPSVGEPASSRADEPTRSPQRSAEADDDGGVTQAAASGTPSPSVGTPETTQPPTSTPPTALPTTSAAEPSASPASSRSGSDSVWLWFVIVLAVAAGVVAYVLRKR
jgi:hypothetical protein